MRLWTTPAALLSALGRAIFSRLAATGGVWFGAVLLVLVLPLVVGLLFVGASEHSVFGDVFGLEWSPLRGLLGLGPLVAGTLAVTLVAVLFAAPIGIGAAIGLAYFVGPRWRVAGRITLGVLAALPSVVIGLSATTNLVPHLGASLLTGAIAVGAMIVPTCGLLALAELEMVPAKTVEAGCALGVSRDSVLYYIVLRMARPGLIKAVGIAVCRALGEALAVAMVCGNVAQLPDSFLSPVRTLTTAIVLEFEYSAGPHRAALHAGALMSVLLMALAAGVSLYYWSKSREALGVNHA